jgi:hypothetical protein
MAAVVRPPVRWIFSSFDPLSFVAFPYYAHDSLARKWLKCLPLFAGRSRESIEDHLPSFSKLLDDFEVEHEDVAMRMFVSNLEGQARTWYKSLPDAFIDGWDLFQEKFVERWANKLDNSSLINVFTHIKKNGDETVTDFNALFSKNYYKIPITIRLNDACALIFFLEAFDGILGIFLGNKEPRTLKEAQVVAIKLERDFMAAYGFILIHDFQLPIFKAVQEVCVIEDELQLTLYQVPRDEHEGYSPILDDPEQIAAPFKSHAEFQEDEGEDFSTQECLLVPPISEDEKF